MSNKNVEASNGVTSNADRKSNISSEAEDHWVPVEEQLIHVEVHGLYRDDVLKSKTSLGRNNTGEDSSVFQLTGLESREPMLQIGRQIFAGTYSDSADTSLFFRCTANSESEIPKPEDEVFAKIPPRLSSQFLCKTKKFLTFKRVFLHPVNQ